MKYYRRKNDGIISHHEKRMNPLYVDKRGRYKEMSDDEPESLNYEVLVENVSNYPLHNISIRDVLIYESRQVEIIDVKVSPASFQAIIQNGKVLLYGKVNLFGCGHKVITYQVFFKRKSSSALCFENTLIAETKRYSRKTYCEVIVPEYYQEVEASTKCEVDETESTVAFNTRITGKKATMVRVPMYICGAATIPKDLTVKIQELTNVEAYNEEGQPLMVNDVVTDTMILLATHVPELEEKVCSLFGIKLKNLTLMTNRNMGTEISYIVYQQKERRYGVECCCTRILNQVKAAIGYDFKCKYVSSVKPNPCKKD